MHTNLLPSFTNPTLWAKVQWGKTKLGDIRRTRRAVLLGANIAVQSAASLPKQSGSWGNLKAAYRLLNSSKVTHQSLSQSHWQATLAQAELTPSTVVLFIQDTSTLDFTTHFALTGGQAILAPAIKVMAFSYTVACRSFPMTKIRTLLV